MFSFNCNYASMIIEPSTTNTYETGPDWFAYMGELSIAQL